MKIAISMILMLIVMAALPSCSFFEIPTQSPLGKPQAFLFSFSEPMDPQTALDSSNYLIIDTITQDTIEVGNVKFARKQQINDSTWIDLEIGQWVALYPAKHIYGGAYYIEIWDLEDLHGNVIEPNPSKIKVKYEPKELKVE